MDLSHHDVGGERFVFGGRRALLYALSSTASTSTARAITSTANWKALVGGRVSNELIASRVRLTDAMKRRMPRARVLFTTAYARNAVVHQGRLDPGMKLLTLADLGEVWAVVYVPQPLLAKLSLDMEVEGVLPELPGKRFKGRVSHIHSEAEFTPKNVQTREERTRLVFGVKVRFPNPDRVLKPGMTVEVRLPRA